MDHLLTVTFATRDAARIALDRLSGDPAAAGLGLDDVCVVARDQGGAVYVAAGRSEGADDPFWQLLVEDLALGGTPGEANAAAGLPSEFVGRLAGAMPPGRSALLALTNGIDVEAVRVAVGGHERLLQCELGDGGGEALRQRIMPSAVEPPVWPSGFGSFQ